MSTENREVAYLKDKPLSEDYSYVYGELEDGSIVKVSKEQLGIEQIKESVSELNRKIEGTATPINKITASVNQYVKIGNICLFHYDFTVNETINYDAEAIFSNLPKAIKTLSFLMEDFDGSSHLVGINSAGSLTTGWLSNIPKDKRLKGYIIYLCQ